SVLREALQRLSGHKRYSLDSHETPRIHSSIPHRQRTHQCQPSNSPNSNFRVRRCPPRAASLAISPRASSRIMSSAGRRFPETPSSIARLARRAEEHTSELQSRFDLVCRLLLEKKKKKINQMLT